MPHCLDNRWRWGCQPYAQAALYPPGRFLILISVTGSIDSRAILRLEGLGKLEKDSMILSEIEFTHSDCSIVPQPTIHCMDMKYSVCINIKWAVLQEDIRGSGDITRFRVSTAPCPLKSCYTQWIGGYMDPRAGVTYWWRGNGLFAGMEASVLIPYPVNLMSELHRVYWGSTHINSSWRPTGLWDVEDRTLSRESAHRWR
jgi:hypothetical protein